jgi:hypothetical protein
MDIEEVLARHEKELMKIAGVNGVGIGEHHGKPVILVMLDRPASQLQVPIPGQLEGVPVVVEDIGEVTAS